MRNSPTALHCIADGNPLPVYTWTWKGHNVTNSTRGMIIHQNGRMLIVKRVNDRYSGRFHCSVTNSIGSRLGIIKIQPTGKMNMIMSFSSSYVSVSVRSTSSCCSRCANDQRVC